MASLIQVSRFHGYYRLKIIDTNLNTENLTKLHLNFEQIYVYDKTYQRVRLEIRTSNAEKYFLNSTKTEVDLGKTIKQQNWNLFAKIRNPNAYSAKLTV